MDFEQLRIFSRVAQLASFSKAAEQLGMAKSQVSAAVRLLEEGLGARLLHRTTRSVRLTQDGEHFLERCQELMNQAEQLDSMFRPAAGGLQGKLRIDLPNMIAHNVIIARLPEFLAAHPDLEVGISTTDRRVDLVHEGFDCVLRVGALGDSELVARTLGQMRMVNVASPAYLQAHGTPHTLADLAGHRLVHYVASLASNGSGWEYWDAAQGRYATLPMRGAVTVNGTQAYQAAAVAGLGIIQAPVLGCRKLLDEGRLVEIMPDHTAAPMPVSLIYANRRQLAPRVVTVMDWLAQVLAPFLSEAPNQADTPYTGQKPATGRRAP